jgi:enolase-phosphatase E1
VTPQADDSQIRVVLLDIEGTTTPVDFVYNTLFPYASRRMESFLREHSGESEIQSLNMELRLERQRDETNGLQPPAWNDETDELLLHSSVAYVKWLMARDSKCTPLKMLQGKIWQQAYAEGELHGEVYADVPRAFARWNRQGREISIYSSGSVLAQQLLFRTIATGDLTRYISAFFDARIGGKIESDSYCRIAESVKRSPSEVLFVSDTIKEVEAARLARMRALLCRRDADATNFGGDKDTIREFDQILPD